MFDLLEAIAAITINQDYRPVSGWRFLGVLEEDHPLIVFLLNLVHV